MAYLLVRLSTPDWPHKHNHTIWKCLFIFILYCCFIIIIVQDITELNLVEHQFHITYSSDTNVWVCVFMFVCILIYMCFIKHYSIKQHISDPYLLDLICSFWSWYVMLCFNMLMLGFRQKRYVNKYMSTPWNM